MSLRWLGFLIWASSCMLQVGALRPDSHSWDMLDHDDRSVGSQEQGFAGPGPDFNDNAGKPAAQASLSAGCSFDGQKNPSNVTFKLLVKNFYGLNLAASSWNVDLILFYSWTDPRASALVDIPAGSDTASLSMAQAQSKCIWMPDISVTNVASASDFKTISQTVIVGKDGAVSVTERDLVGLKSRYDLTHFPFDEQELVVRVASTTLMADSLTLETAKEDENDAASKESLKAQMLKKGFALEELKLQTLVESDGPLVKSRGELHLRILRDWSSMTETVFLPEVLVTVLPLSMFFSPLLPPFAMPRVAASLIPLLCMVGFMQKSASMVPHASGWIWLDVYEAACLLLIVTAFVMNQLLQYVFHSLALPDVAEQLQLHYRYLYGGLFVVLNILAFVCRHFVEMTQLGALVFGTYIVFTVIALWVAHRGVRREKDFDANAEEVTTVV
eukprot:CAMPEP_0178436068 /NCGR_PEP_ID=MMETSP0689_2-20121128/34251_1 /TAXON_ID=160604 /ORGANISM="Amphidinium massartii, Strain CS-259" /LENGTH=443 /DNA_ID=CAMNT_0020058157 /DNA_START=69 /DNA_END=1397 /DNA_ORIENTATION=+